MNIRSARIKGAKGYSISEVRDIISKNIRNAVGFEDI